MAQKRIQITIGTDDLKEKIKADCQKTGLKESQWIYLIINKYYYENPISKAHETR